MATWTEEQKQAIITRNCNLLVAAAAGSGKTSVLVERIIRQICDDKSPVDVDRLLVVTFTNAAALEMKERIGLAVNKALKEAPHSRHLYKQATLINKASIMTLHSFCLEVIRENFYRLGIDPNFRVADDTEAELLRLDVLEDLLEKYYLSCKEGDSFFKLIDTYGGQNDDSLVQDMILKLYDISHSTPWPEYWLNKIVDNFTSVDWFNRLLPGIEIQLNRAKSLLLQALNLAQRPEGPFHYINNLKEEISFIDDLIGAGKISWEKLQKIIEEGNFNKLPRIKKGEVDPEIQKRVKELRDKGKEILNDLKNKYFLRKPQELMGELEIIKPYLKILCQLVKDFKKDYQEAKLKRNVVDFNDLEHFCLKILLDEKSGPGNLIPSEISKKLQERFVEILVDEYQDINEVQETILNLIARKNNLFMVGDVKQSIYRFRLANPELFLLKYLNFNNEMKGENCRVELSQNFRCRQEIVNAVNFLYQQIMTPKIGEISYDERAKLKYSANYPEGRDKIFTEPVEIHILEKNAEEDREALIIGKKIKELINENYVVFDKNLQKYRLLTYKDIVILMRSPKGKAETLVDVFQQLDIPVFADLGGGYFTAVEIQTIISLLKIIDNPRQDIPLVALLRSPILGLTSEELSMIRLKKPGLNFYDVLKEVARDSDVLGEKLKEFLRKLEKWRTLARQSNLADLIWTLYKDTGYFDYVGAMPGGSQRQANLRALHDRAQQFEATSFRGLFMFLRFLERLQENHSDLEAAKAIGENEDVVRIMSIHKSKGLEFPVVFVTGLGREFNMIDTRQDVLLHKDLGFGPVYIDPEKRIKYPSIAKLVVENKIKFETLAEEMRVLYVALTRAKEKLILVGSLKNIEKKVENWSQVLSNTIIEISDDFLVGAKNYLDWIGPALIRHKDGLPLRQVIGFDNYDLKLLSDDSKWDIFIYPEEVFEEKEEKIKAFEDILEQVKELKPVQIDIDIQNEVNKKLNWKYPYQEILGKGAKITVTEVKHRFQDIDKESVEYLPVYNYSKRPLFLQDQGDFSAAEKGSVMHLVMQHIDSKQEITFNYIKNLLYKLEEREILTPNQIKIVNPNVIMDFFNSSLGKRLINAEKVYRELPFSLTLPASIIYPELEGTSEKVFLQGIIDCIFYEKTGWILIDYKSDNVTPKKLNQLIKGYRGQINLYSQAVEKIYKQPVLERYLYLFKIGQAIKV